jgi:hypothetical protein
VSCIVFHREHILAVENSTAFFVDLSTALKDRGKDAKTGLRGALDKTHFDWADVPLDSLVRYQEITVDLEADFGWEAEEGCQAGIGGAPCGNVGDVADGFPGWCSTERAWRWLRRWAKGEQTIDDG